MIRNGTSCMNCVARILLDDKLCRGMMSLQGARIAREVCCL
jgi:hypothetical protein